MTHTSAAKFALSRQILTEVAHQHEEEDRGAEHVEEPHLPRRGGGHPRCLPGAFSHMRASENPASDLGILSFFRRADRGSSSFLIGKMARD